MTIGCSVPAVNDHPGEDMPVFRFAFEVTRGGWTAATD